MPLGNSGVSDCGDFRRGGGVERQQNESNLVRVCCGVCFAPPAPLPADRRRQLVTPPPGHRPCKMPVQLQTRLLPVCSCAAHGLTCLRVLHLRKRGLGAEQRLRRQRRQSARSSGGRMHQPCRPHSHRVHSCAFAAHPCSGKHHLAGRSKVAAHHGFPCPPLVHARACGPR